MKQPTASDWRLRRRQLAELIDAGTQTRAAAAKLGVSESIIRRDRDALRAAAKSRRPWHDLGACAASFIEDAEAVLQKVRAAQSEVDHSTGAYHNFVKLEFVILIKFIEMSQNRSTENREANSNEIDDYTNLSNEQLIKTAHDLGIDTTGFERALGPDAPDLDEAA